MQSIIDVLSNSPFGAWGDAISDYEYRSQGPTGRDLPYIQHACSINTTTLEGSDRNVYYVEAEYFWIPK